ncbi:uncharacterized protein LOC121746015 [Salvia splendens]|uniref:uncharacterized protein LOC121746015 n=1 Tax=Salvia splendens TaxID=180675 RepID=UPI001C2698C3|nr:uncharacterized protein LOC121746015 [Salvia splendens]
MKLDSEASPSSGIETVKLNVENLNGSSGSGVDQLATNEVLPDEVQVRGTNLSEIDTRSAHRARFRNFARRNASRFAHFSARDEFGDRAHDASGTDVAPPETSNRIENWPGPFSTAMKIIKDSETNRNGGKHGGSTDVSETVELKWIPKNHESCRHQKHVPSLQDICLSILSSNADAITSLDFVPDALRHKICWFLCDNRSMDGHFLELLVHDTPTEIRIRDCSWLSEEQFVKIFGGFNTSKLTVLQFDQGGACMPDYILRSTLARLPNSLPALTTISLKGAYRLSDAGLNMLASVMRLLLHILMLMGHFSSACRLIRLYRSIDKFILFYCLIYKSYSRRRMRKDKEYTDQKKVVLCLVGSAVCLRLTALSLARNCKNLHSLDLSWCRNLTNEALGLIVDSCLLLEVLKLFGCTQVTDVFVDGHSNPQVKLIGLKMTPVFKHIEFPDFLLGPLRYPSASL